MIGQVPSQRSGPGMYSDYYFQGDSNGWGTSNVSGLGTWIKGEGSQVHQGMYEGMALPDRFLGQYYSQVRNHYNISVLHLSWTNVLKIN